jgi:predicted RNA-binding Zn ribbon-like protein
MFRWLGEPLAIDLANTVMVVRGEETVDLLSSVGDLALWLAEERERIGDLDLGGSHLEELRVIREAIRQAFSAQAEGSAPAPEALARINAASAASPVAPQLGVDERGRLVAGQSDEGAGSLPGLLGKLARSAIEVLADAETVPLKICTAPSCGMFFLGRRRWCCSACGNRARVARHYRRTAAGAGAPG